IWEAPTLEAERHLKIDSAIVGSGTERPASQRVLLAKNRRADYSNRIPGIHVVENVSGKDRKRQAVLLSGVVSAKRPAASDASFPAASASKRYIRSATGGVAGRFAFLAESKSLAQA